MPNIDLTEDDIGAILAAVENLRGGQTDPEKRIEAAWRIATKLEAIGTRAMRGGWRSIDTAPKDGSYVLVHNSLRNTHVARWGHRHLGDPNPDAWVCDGKHIGGVVRCWQPMPQPPEINEQVLCADGQGASEER